MSEKIGDTWYYVEVVRPAGPENLSGYEIRLATIIGETPRKWILRKKLGDSIQAAPGESFYDFSIPKKGGTCREGKGQRGSICNFLATYEDAQREVGKRQDQVWTATHAGKIGQRVGWLRDPVILRQIASLIGYKEEEKV